MGSYETTTSLNRRMIRAALLLALLLVAQGLRLLLPLPPVLSVFLVGSLVNACLLISTEVAGWRLAALSAVVAPVVAYLQQLLPLPILIVPVAAANLAYLGGYHLLRLYNRKLAIVAATVVKAGLLWFSVNFILDWLAAPVGMKSLLQAMLGGAQLITGITGGILCLLLTRKINKAGLGNVFARRT